MSCWWLYCLFCNFCCSNSARFLFKVIPSAVKERQPEVLAAWKIGQRLWIKDYCGVHEAIREFNWSPEAQSVVAAFSGIALWLYKNIYTSLFAEHFFSLLSNSFFFFLNSLSFFCCFKKFSNFFWFFPFSQLSIMSPRHYHFFFFPYFL